MNFDFLTGSIGKMVQLERGGPDKVVGELVDVRSDYLVLRTEAHGVLYCASHHVKALTEPTELRIEASEDSNEPQSAAQEPQEPKEPQGEAQQGEESDRSQPNRRIPVVEATTFSDLLASMKHRLVQVNHSGPNALKGVVMDVGSDSITVLHDIKDYVHYPLFHIRSVSLIYEVGDSNQGNDQGGGDQKGGSDSGKNQGNGQGDGDMKDGSDSGKNQGNGQAGGDKKGGKVSRKNQGNGKSESNGKTARGTLTNTSRPTLFVPAVSQYGGLRGYSRPQRTRRRRGA